MNLKPNPFVDLLRALRADAVYGGTVKITQPESGYRAAVDPILLAAATPLTPGIKILDVGCGVGTAGLCVLRRAQKAGTQIGGLVGIDRQKILIDLAQQNIELNEFTQMVEFVQADIAESNPSRIWQNFDCVITNPPYLRVDSADPSPDPIKAIANIETTANLSSWIEFCAKVLRPNGAIVMIHRADRVAEIMEQLQNVKCRQIDVIPIYPKYGQDAKRVLVKATKNPACKSRLLTGIVLHELDGRYTESAQFVLDGRTDIKWNE